jgi:hypothetical protein
MRKKRAKTNVIPMREVAQISGRTLLDLTPFYSTLRFGERPGVNRPVQTRGTVTSGSSTDSFV